MATPTDAFDWPAWVGWGGYVHAYKAVQIAAFGKVDTAPAEPKWSTVDGPGTKSDQNCDGSPDGMSTTTIVLIVVGSVVGVVLAGLAVVLALKWHKKRVKAERRGRSAV